MKRLAIAGIAYLLLLPAGAWFMVWREAPEKALLNVSYDPTRELWREMNHAFREEYERESGKRIAISQSHGASGSQARAVIDGLEADVVSLALWSDTDQLRKAGLIAADWDKRRTLPYYSTIVFVVRAGNPKKIRDWDDLIRADVSIITPNPKTSGNGKLSLLAAWGATRKAGKSETEAEQYVAELYRHAPVLDTGARGAAMTFSQKKIGDVHLTWENEAYLEVNESAGSLEIIYPRWSIRAEPHVAIVEANVDRRGTREAAQKYVDFCFTPRGQQIIAKHYYRPSDDSYRNSSMPDVNLFDLSVVAKDWGEAQKRFFADGGVFDRIYQRK